MAGRGEARWGRRCSGFAVARPGASLDGRETKTEDPSVPVRDNIGSSVNLLNDSASDLAEVADHSSPRAPSPGLYHSSHTEHTQGTHDEAETSEDTDNEQVIFYTQHPTFITVIGMLPETMFWVIAAPVVEYGGRVFDVLSEKLMGMKVEE